MLRVGGLLLCASRHEFSQQRSRMFPFSVFVLVAA